jgi:hypothetical protein
LFTEENFSDRSTVKRGQLLDEENMQLSTIVLAQHDHTIAEGLVNNLYVSFARVTAPKHG